MIEVKERRGLPKKSLQELSELLGVYELTVSKFHGFDDAMGLIEKQGNWVPYEMKSRHMEIRLFACEQLIEHQKGRVFCIALGLAMKSGSIMTTPSKKVMGFCHDILQYPVFGGTSAA